MPEKIDHKHPVQFERLCAEHRVQYPSTVHHFEKEENGRYKIVLWRDTKLEKAHVRS